MVDTIFNCTIVFVIHYTPHVVLFKPQIRNAVKKQDTTVSMLTRASEKKKNPFQSNQITKHY